MQLIRPHRKRPMNSLATQLGDKESGKQVIVSNYYIRDKEEGWKQVKLREISPNNPIITHRTNQAKSR